MTPEEVEGLLSSERVVVCASRGPRGWPHLMPLWYVVREGEVWAWTYAKSQKVRNLERDDRATLQVETGTAYDELRGVMIEARAAIHRELEVVSALGLKLLERYADTAASAELARSAEALAALRRQAAKRVALQFLAERTASWDHRKLGAGGT